MSYRDPDSRTGRLFANRTFLLVFFAIALAGSIAFTVSTFSSAHPYARDPNDFHLISQLLGPWFWPLADGLFLVLLVYTAMTSQARLSELSRGRASGQSPAAVQSRLVGLVVVGGGVFLVAWAISAVLGDDTTHVRQAIGAAAIFLGFAAMTGSAGWNVVDGGTRGRRGGGPTRGGGLAS